MPHYLEYLNFHISYGPPTSVYIKACIDHAVRQSIQPLNHDQYNIVQVRLPLTLGREQSNQELRITHYVAIFQ